MGVSQIDLLKLEKAQKAESALKDKLAELHPKMDALNTAFVLLLSATNLSMQSAQTDAKCLQAAQTQMAIINDDEAQYSFKELAGLKGSQVATKKVWISFTDRMGPSLSMHVHSKWTLRKASATDLDKINIVNQGVEQQRNFIGNRLMVVQQNAQITSSTLNTTTDFSSQQIQEIGNICSLLTQVTNLISQVGRSS